MAQLAKIEFGKRALAAATAARAMGAPISPRVAAAQAALESAYGTSQLARVYNNLFGVKATKRWAGQTVELPTREYDKETGLFVATTATWRVYVGWEECFADYGRIIDRLPWYADAARAARDGDDAGFLRGLCASPGEPGWATDPHYANKIRVVARIINVRW